MNELPVGMTRVESVPPMKRPLHLETAERLLVLRANQGEWFRVESGVYATARDKYLRGPGFEAARRQSETRGEQGQVRYDIYARYVGEQND